MSAPRSDSRPDPGADALGRRVRRTPPAVVIIVVVLLLGGIVPPLLVSTYADRDPVLWGFPFFYWYLLLWVFLSSGLTALANLVLTRGRAARRGDR